MPRLFYALERLTSCAGAFLCLHRPADPHGSGEKGRGDYRGEGIRGNYRLILLIWTREKKKKKLPGRVSADSSRYASRTAPGAFLSPPISLHYETRETAVNCYSSRCGTKSTKTGRFSSFLYLSSFSFGYRYYIYLYIKYMILPNIANGY